MRMAKAAFTPAHQPEAQAEKSQLVCGDNYESATHETPGLAGHVWWTTKKEFNRG